MMELIEKQVYLVQGTYARVISRSEGLVCDAMHYALVALHVRIQTAAAYELLGKHREAGALPARALADAEPDGLVLPFVENYRYLRPLLAQDMQGCLVRRIMELCEATEQRRRSTERPAILATLTEREYEIVLLMAGRLTNRGIAERLFLSEGSTEQYVNQIYAKLHIEGDTRAKRRQLAALLSQNH